MDSVEQAAIRYLARCEQNENALRQKLLKKGFNPQDIECTLNSLKQKNYLNDDRFALSWLHTRSITQHEAKPRLLIELQKRGITRETAQKALEIFFTETSEEEVLQKAIDKCKRLKKSKESSIRYLLSKGFGYSNINKFLLLPKDE